jgi:SAM-dependent methyltransferase
MARSANRSIKVDLGCGNVQRQDFYGLDVNSSLCPTIVGNIDGSHLPFLSGSVNLLVCYDVLEHIHQLIALMNECHRVLNESGILSIRVPYGGSYWAMVDPTHVRQFYPETFSYFTPDSPLNYDQIKKWKIIEVKCFRLQTTAGMKIRNLIPAPKILSRFVLGMYDGIEATLMPIKL